MNGQPTPDLDAFISVVRQLPDGADVRVRLVHFESNKSKVGCHSACPGCAPSSLCWMDMPLDMLSRSNILVVEASQVLTLKTDHRYWPTWQLVLDSVTAEWTREPISSPI